MCVGGWVEVGGGGGVVLSVPLFKMAELRHNYGKASPDAFCPTPGLKKRRYEDLIFSVLGI